MPKLLVAGGMALSVWACSNVTVSPPGNEKMGTYSLSAELIDAGCPSALIPEPTLSFFAIFSRMSGTQEAFLTLGNSNTEATFDGQTFHAERQAPRRFDFTCGGEGVCNATELKEVLDVALVSKSQDEALFKKTGVAGCPDDLAVLQSVTKPDAGIVLPDMTPRGFDAVRACGTLKNEVVTDKNVSTCLDCPPCFMLYRVRGERR